MNDVFVDTSILIARVIHSPEKKRKIEARLSQYSGVYTGLVAKQEYKRRLLKTAQYLLNQLDSKKSFKIVRRHIDDHLSNVRRKQVICQQLLDTVHECRDGETDAELTDRAKSHLRNLIRLGLEDLDDTITQIVDDSGCACAKIPIIEKEPYKSYEFGSDKCSKVAKNCDVIEFIRSHKPDLQKILEVIKNLPPAGKTEELKRAENFIEKVLSDHSRSPFLDSCLTVGDLMIALESANFECFYTMNIKESEHLCYALKQTLIVRPSHADKEDEVYSYQ